MIELNELNGKDYLLTYLEYKTAPTRKGVKPSSLISFSTQNKNLYGLWNDYKDQVCLHLGLQFFELKKTHDWLLVLFYDYSMLEETTSSHTNQSFLHKMGYEHADTLDERLLCLKKRFKRMCPHEIGVFLGIPIEDVYGFIRHKGRGFLMCKYWKVYHNLEQAKNLFECYDQAKMHVIYTMLHRAS